jgi:multidrug resistance efflux pump
MKQRGIVIVIAVVLISGAAIVIVVRAFHGRRNSQDYSGTIETREIEVGSKIGGRVTEVSVEEGQEVMAGALLVRFESNDLIAQRRQAQAEVDQQRTNRLKVTRGNRPEEIQQSEANARALSAAFEEARNGPRPQDIAQAQADYEAAQADAINAQSNFERMQKLVETDTISRMEFDSDRDKRDSATKKAESARQRLAELQVGTRREDIQVAEAHYQQAQAAATLSRKGSRSEDIAAARDGLTAAQEHVADLDVALSEAQLAAPADGIVETVSVRPGDLVPPGRIVLTMLEPTQLWVKVYVPETDLSKVKLGQSAQVTVDGMPGHNFTGHVGQIASRAEFLPRNVQTPDDRQHQVFGVKVYVDNANGALKSGMSASVVLE